MSWNMELASGLLLGMSLGSLLFVSKKGLKQPLMYCAFAGMLQYENTMFFNAAPIFLLILFLFRDKEIRRGAYLSVLLMTCVAAGSCWSLANGNWAETDDFHRYMLWLRNGTSFSSIATAGILFLPSPNYRDIPFASTLVLFTMAFYSYANPYSPIVQAAWPLACLSLIPYLYMTTLTNHFEGSFAHIYLTKALRHIAKRLKVGGDSKYTGFVLQVLKLR